MTFPNDDPIFHNVFSLTPTGSFRSRALSSWRFEDASIHKARNLSRILQYSSPNERFLLVLPTSFIAETNPRAITTSNCPRALSVECVVGAIGAGRTEEVAVESASLSAPELTLDESKFVEVQHKNKYGQEYPASAYEPGKR